MTNKTNRVRELNPWVYDLSPLAFKDTEISQWAGKGLLTKADSKRIGYLGRNLT